MHGRSSATPVRHPTRLDVDLLDGWRERWPQTCRPSCSSVRYEEEADLRSRGSPPSSSAGIDVKPKGDQVVFELHAQFLTENQAVTAVYRREAIVVETPSGPHVARTLSGAIKTACDAVGPLMESADRAGEGWGLMVRAGEVSVAYGNWPAGPPGAPGPELEGLRRILDQYRPGDGARAALNNACKIVEAFAERRRGQGGRRAA